MGMRELLGDERFSKTEASVHGVLAGEAQHFETKLPKPDGGFGCLDGRYLPDCDERGTVRGFYVLVTDVSTLEEARYALEVSNAQLTHTNRELDQFVYTASHDLRSPLRAETRDRLKLIISRSQRMQRMLDQILEYARAGKDGGEGTPVEASVLIDDIVATLGLPAAFRVVQDPSLAAVIVHPMPLSQVLQNLIANSVKHHDASHGTVTIAVERMGPGLRFLVTDDGPGIPVEYRESVFEMFTTLKRRDEVEASGMGLALVRKLVKLQGGRCGIEPAPGRGARVWFDWPLGH
jgi:signal transduction histidine kinase